MLALQRSLSLGYLRQRRVRTLLVLLSIALGVATLVATRALSGGLARVARQVVNPLAGVADLLVINAQTGVPRALADRLLAADVYGVEDAQPLTLGRVRVLQEGWGSRSVLLLGIDLTRAGFLPGRRDLARGNPWGAEVEWDLAPAAFLEPFRGRRWALVGGKLAEELGPGTKRFEAQSAGGTLGLLRVGTVRFREGGGLEGGNFVVLDADSAARLVFPGRPGTVSQINVRLAPEVRTDPAAVERVRRQLQEVVGDGADVRTLDANFETARDVTAGLELGFAIGGAGALVVGLFLVYNALSVSVAERRHDIGVLRAVGATRPQVTGLFLAEAVFLGLVGSVLGLPLGWGLAHAALGPLQSVLSDMMSPTDAVPVEVPVGLMVVAVLAGTATAVLAALVPAVQAAEEEPADAVRRGPRSVRSLYLALHLAAVALLVGGGVAAVVLRARLPVRAGVFAGIVLILTGALAAMPLLSGLLGRLLLPLLRPLLGLEGRLAADNLVRSPGRTGIVVAALAATGALMVQTAGFIRSTEDAVLDWIDHAVAADLFVTSGGSLSSASAALPMDEHVATQLRKLPEVESALGVRIHLLDFRDRIVFLLAVDADAFAATPGRDYARNLRRYPRLREPGTALVSENFAALYGLHTGDRFEVRGRHGPIPLEIIGTIRDYTWNRGTITVSRAWYREQFADRQLDLCDLYLKPGSDPEAVRRELQRRWGTSEGLFAMTRAEVHDDVRQTLHRVYNLAYAQQAVVGVVALLGVASALFISVLQRRRELGLLRAVGASRGQVLRSVAAEAALMGLVGGVLGFGVGLLLEWYIVDVMVWDEAGFTFPLVVPWTAAAVVFAASALLATLVGLWPAYHATRLRIPEAIAYE
jgi:putative ABC transport system permease protein